MLNGSYLYQPELGLPTQTHSILFYVDWDNPQGSFPQNPTDDPQFSNWEWAVQRAFPSSTQ